MRWDSPFVLAAAGTLAVHLALVTGGDALVVTHPRRSWTPAPHLELVEIEVPPVLAPPPPPPPAAEPPKPVEPVAPLPAPRARTVRATPSPPRAAEPPPPPTSETPAPSGGEQVVHMDDVAPSATGVGVAVGAPVTGRIGRGGRGGGTGAGSGSGTGDAPPRPVSVATIKTSAMPKGDQSYINIGKDYPAEARDLGIGGKIVVMLTIDEHGAVKARRLLNRLGHGLDELALEYAARLEFEPAKDTDDRPVASVVKWTFDMTPPK